MTILRYPIKRSALAKAYKISDRTFTLWLRDIEIPHKRTLSPAELKKIIAHYDLPGDVQVII